MINDLFLQLVRDTLPEATAGELKKFLEQAEKDKAVLAQCKEKLEEKDTTIKMYEKQIKELTAKVEAYKEEKRDLAERQASLIEGAKAVAERERILDLTLAQNEARSANNSYHNLLQLMQVAFKNPVVKRSIHSNEQVPTYTTNEWDGNSNAYVDKITGYGNKSEETTEEIE